MANRYLILIFMMILSGVSFAEQSKAEPKDSSLYLESTFIGDKEQPTVSYFIPWKDTGTPDKLHWNIEEKHDRSLEIIDRDIMLRSMSIYNELDMETTGGLE